MGMFDRVWARCPKCGAQVEFQSKAGECSLINYSFDSVPVEIAADLSGKEQRACDSCGATLRLWSIGVPPQTVKMIAEVT